MTYGVFGSYGELFLKQGRPLFPFSGCAILCITTYSGSNSREELRNRIVTRSFPPPFTFRHAEQLVFNEIKVIEEVYNSKAVRVELYSSYSPCIKCCGLIEDFLSCRPGCKMSIAFTCVYRHRDQQQRSALKRLRKNKSVIRLDVFGEKDWEVLREMELVIVTPGQQREMRHWDEYWRNILDDVLGWQRVVHTMSPFSEVCQRQSEAIHSDNADLKTDAVRAFHTAISACQVAAGGAWVCHRSSAGIAGSNPARKQPVSLVGERQMAVIHSDNTDLKTDAVPTFQKRISAYQEAGFPSQAKLEEMDRKVRAAIRRRNREDLLLFVALAFVLLFFLWLIFF